jgi:molecular chaperone DnaK (HSP70)
MLTTQMLLEQVLDMAKLQYNIGKDQIEVMLTGGSSRMPMVKKMIEGVIGKPPIQHRNPELLVTIGAAYWAHLLQSGSTVTTHVRASDGTVEEKPVTVSPGGLVDMALYAVGIEVLRPDGQGQMASYNAVIIPSGAKYGEVFKREFAVAYDGQTDILIKLYKGDSSSLDECTLLMEFTISGLPTGRPKGQPVQVTTACDVKTGQQVDIIVDRSKTAL